jgi:capsular polysaccharide biosynthesis protein/Mrp family chromosome partitioning ATPase
VATTEKTLPELVSSARRGWLVVLAVAVSVLAGAAFYAERQPKQYDATAIVAISPRPAVPNPDLVRIAAPKYASFITAPQTVRQVAEQLGQDPVELRRRVKATVVTDTGNIIITVRQRRPDRAAAAANALADRVELRSQDDKLVSGDVISTADPPRSPAPPSPRLIEASALFVGLMLGIGVVALANWFRAGTNRTQSPVRSLPGGLPTNQYPVVGNLPWSRQLESQSSALLGDPTITAAGEALRANVTRELGGQVRGLIVVTSPPGSHGKTLVANLLSTLLARAGERVLLVGTQWQHSLVPRGLRNGDEPTRMIQPNELGGDGTELGWVKNVWALEEGLWILPMRHGLETSDRPAAQMLDKACEMFDAVVVDSPSIVSRESARTLTWRADVVLLVVSSVAMDQPRYQSLQRLLHSLSPPFAGIVVNQRGSGTRREAHV